MAQAEPLQHPKTQLFHHETLANLRKLAASGTYELL